MKHSLINGEKKHEKARKACITYIPGQPKKVSCSFLFSFPAMTTIVTPLERGRAGKSFKRKSFFKKSILRCLNQYSNLPDIKSYNQNLVCIRKEQVPMLVNKQLKFS